MAAEKGGVMYSLDAYRTHVDKFGPEFVLETAARDLSLEELGELKAHIQSLERVHRWRNGQWVEVRSPRPRACEACGLDLPVDARANKRFHDDACRLRFVRQKSVRQRPTAFSRDVWTPVAA